MMNVDLKCAEFGSNIANLVKDENLITKSLGVLQEDGVYAFFLFLESKKEDKAKNIKDEIFKLLAHDEILKDTIEDEEEPLKALKDKFKDKLDELLFAKEVLERTLVYARYHAKALGE